MPRRGYQQMVTLTTSDALVLPANPHRDYLALSNQGPLSVTLSFGQPSSPMFGIVLPPGERPWVLTREELGQIIGLEIRGQAFSAGGLAPFAPASAIGQGLSGASTGVKLSQVNNVGPPGELLSATVGNIAGGAPTLQLQLVRGATTIVLAQTTTQLIWGAPIALASNDTVQWAVTTLAAGSTFDATISLLMGSELDVNNTAAVTMLIGEQCGMPY